LEIRKIWTRRLSENRLTAHFSEKSLEVLQNIPRL